MVALEEYNRWTESFDRRFHSFTIPRKHRLLADPLDKCTEQASTENIAHEYQHRTAVHCAVPHGLRPADHRVVVTALARGAPAHLNRWRGTSILCRAQGLPNRVDGQPSHSADKPLEPLMMASDRSHQSNGERFPSDATVEIVRAALSQYLGGALDDEQVCEALAVLAQEASAKRLTAENLLVAFRQVWNEMPEVRAMRNPAERKFLLDHLVKLCIDAVYKR